MVGTRQVGGGLLRVTLRGPELDGFSALGPTDHIKLFLPDPATGVLHAPWITDDGGLQRPDHGVSISRDYTPLNHVPATANGEASIDIDCVLHKNPGPATRWAAQAAPGQEVVVVGPRGSVLAPTATPHVVLIADETALPAVSRWLELLDPETRITAILQGEDESVEDYLTPNQHARAAIEWLYREDGPGQVYEAVRSLTLDDSTYVWAAGEATELIPVRRHLRRELGFELDQMSVQGYWKRGVVNLDHHAPIDESDPE
ncbi:siderophore-interacting protein [Klugiella xanthotipulae]